jgi:flagellar assembly factor FliW
MSAATVNHESPSDEFEVSELRIVRSHAFGEAAVPARAIMHFAEPLWGFPERTAYALLPAARQGLYWLQSIDDELTTFILADPFVLDTSYAFTLSDTERAALRANAPEDVIGLVMLTLPTSPEGTVTANFRAPLAFNLGRQTAIQFVTSEERHGLRQPVDLSVFPAQPDGLRML